MPEPYSIQNEQEKPDPTPYGMGEGEKLDPTPYGMGEDLSQIPDLTQRDLTDPGANPANPNYIGEQNKITPSASPIPGYHGPTGNRAQGNYPNPANPSENPKDGTSSNAEMLKAGTEIAAKAAAGDYLGAAKQLATDKAAQNLAKQGFKLWLKQYQLVAWGILIVVCLIGFAVAGVASLSSKTGNTPTSVAVGSSDTIAGGTFSNDKMSATLDAKFNGKTVHLTLGGTVGKFSEEEAIDPSSGCIRAKQCLAMWSTVKKMGGYQPSWATFYITSRWPSQASYYNGVSKPASQKGYPGMPNEIAYAGKRMIIYNPKTGKAIVGIAAEFGPAPWTGTVKNGTEYSQQNQLWQQGSHGGWRITNPEGYAGRTAGGIPALEHAIGADNMTTIYFGFATDQNAVPGTLYEMGTTQASTTTSN